MWRPVVGGKDIARYAPLPKQSFVHYAPALLDAPRDPAIWIADEKLIVQEVRNITLSRRIVATLDRDKTICLQTTNAITLKPGVTEWPLSALLAILNSAATNHYFRERFRGNNHISGKQLGLIPIPAATPTEQATLSALVDRILAAKRAGDEATVKALEAEIDTHVFRLYGLTPEEIQLVQESARK